MASSPGPAASEPAAGLYETIHRRRDVRCEFSGAPPEPATLERVLGAAHAAPSVGMSQPWDFIVVDDPDLRRRFRAHVCDQRQTFAATLPPERREVFDGIKIEGILEASLGIVVTYHPGRGTPAVLGRHTIDDAGLYSVCLAIENLWLAATAEGWGVGWVSFYSEAFLAELVAIPPPLRPVAWLCTGPVTHLASVPDLEERHWRSRRPLSDAVHHNRFRPPLPRDEAEPGGRMA